LRLQPLHDHVIEQHQDVHSKCHGHDRVEEGEVAEARVVVGQAPTEGDEQQDVGGRGLDPPGVVAQEEGEPRDQDDQEDRQKDLEQIVGQLEEGNLTLDESLALFERGIRLVRLCSARLESAEQRIESLSGELPRDI
jgi:exodeoxyribonuclease VII small subunit